MADNKVKKVVLAYSGGLDTSIIIKNSRFLQHFQLQSLYLSSINV